MPSNFDLQFLVPGQFMTPEELEESNAIEKQLAQFEKEESQAIAEEKERQECAEFLAQLPKLNKDLCHFDENIVEDCEWIESWMTPKKGGQDGH